MKGTAQMSGGAGHFVGLEPKTRRTLKFFLKDWIETIPRPSWLLRLYFRRRFVAWTVMQINSMPEI